MTVDEAAAALAGIRPFDRLEVGDLRQLAEVGLLQQCSPGAVIHPGAVAVPRLLLVLAGQLRGPDGSGAGSIAGLASMFDPLMSVRLTADPEVGAEILSIDRATFFTFAREFPAIIRGFLELG